MKSFAITVDPPKQPDAPQSAGRVVTVRSNAEFATAVASATPGTTIQLDSSATFSGLTIPDNKDGLTIRPTGDSVTIESVGSTKSPVAYVAALIKDPAERYIVVFTPDNIGEALMTLGRWADDQQLSFTWYDAATLARKMKEDC